MSSERYRILVAEDDQSIRMGLIDALEAEGYGVVAVSNGDDALRQFRQEEPDLLLLDVMMPRKSGYDVCREVRSSNEAVPILMLTAKGEEIDKVLGLELGADDYITKPFGVRELLARVAAALRRVRINSASMESSAPEEAFRFGGVEVEPSLREIRNGNKTIPLTEMEYRLLLVFHRCPNRALTRDQLLNEAWGIDYLGTTRTLDQHVSQLRKKIEPTPGKPVFLITVHGRGYRYRTSD
ncbi:MAG: response regulator transcription factor [Verrucomicrobiota bacterium]